MMYGALPADLGRIDISPVEMMLWLYLPISTPQEALTLPSNVEQFRPLIDAVFNYGWDDIRGNYVYLTAKTLGVYPLHPPSTFPHDLIAYPL